VGTADLIEASLALHSGCEIMRIAPELALGNFYEISSSKTLGNGN